MKNPLLQNSALERVSHGSPWWSRLVFAAHVSRRNQYETFASQRYPYQSFRLFKTQEKS